MISKYRQKTIDDHYISAHEEMVKVNFDSSIGNRSSPLI